MKRSNRKKSKWAFAELHSFIDYKAVLNSSRAVKISAHYTSGQCVRCGHTSKKNRPNNGLMFQCVCCEYQLHTAFGRTTDLIGARNVCMRTLLLRQDLSNMGSLSATPDVSNDEVKAAIGKSFAELRWSSEANPDLKLL